jgi:cyclase
MLKKRLMPCILVRDGLIVQSINFTRYLPIGRPKIAIEYFNRWDVDEIIVLDISANKQNVDYLIELIGHISKIAFIPLSVGGGIKSTDDIEKLLKAGADKVCINTQAVLNPDFIRNSALMFGSQEIVISIDVKRNDHDEYEVFVNGGKDSTGLHPIEWSQRVEQLGAGEILLNSIDHDGTKVGYDVKLISAVTDTVKIPVIAIGGVGNVGHFPAAIIQGGADAVSAANIFHYIEHSTIQAKAAMQKAGIDVRINSEVTYSNKILHGRI